MQSKKIVFAIALVTAVIVISSIAYLGQDYEDTIDNYATNWETVSGQIKNNKPVLVIDIRTEDQFQTGHLPGAAHDNFDSSTLEKRVTTIQKRLPEVASTYSLVLVDDDGVNARQVAQSMTEMGMSVFYLEDGMNNLSEELASRSQINISPEELSQKITTNEDIYLLNVREPEELLESKIDGVVNIPLADIFKPSGIDEVPTDKPVIVICGSGNRATIATYQLSQNGIDFQVLDGGMQAWNAMDSN